MSYTVIELDATTAIRLRVPIRRLPVAAEAAERLAGPVFDVCGLVDELDREFAAADPDDARLYAATIGRLALAASRRMGRDGFADAAHHYADVALAWAPSDPEVRANAALAAHEHGDLDRAGDLYRDVLAESPSKHAIGLRLMAASAALSRGDARAAASILGDLPAQADSWAEVWSLRSAADDDVRLAGSPMATDDLAMRHRASADAPSFDVLARGRRAVVDDEHGEFALIRRADGLSGWVRASGLHAPDA